MTEHSASPAAGNSAHQRLDSWKAIAAYLGRDVTTVQRWERREGLPVHRHVHDKLGSVYAFRVEIDEWLRNRRVVGTGSVDAVLETSDGRGPQADLLPASNNVTPPSAQPLTSGKAKSTSATAYWWARASSNA